MKKKQTRLNVIMLILVLGIALMIFFDVKIFRESTAGFVEEHPYLLKEDSAKEVMIGSTESSEEAEEPEGSEEPEAPEKEETLPPEPSGDSHGVGIFSEIYSN